MRRRAHERGPVARRQGAASRSSLWRQFRRHRLAVLSAYFIALLYLVVALADVVAPNGMDAYHSAYTFAPPQAVRFVDASGKFHLRPFVYDRTRHLDPRTFTYTYEERTEERFPLYFFVEGEPYKLFSLIEWNIHLFGNPDVPVLLLGADEFGRDLLSRIIFGARISLTVGLLGVLLTTVLGVLMGGISGFFGGQVDNLIQRLIELTLALPQFPLYLALSAAFPKDWNSVQVFLVMIVVLSIVNWGFLARQLRGKILALREVEYVSGARAIGAGDFRILLKHVIPNTLSHIIAVATLAIPSIILTESALSFLGVGIQAPMVSLGVLLTKAQNLTYIHSYPWLMLPGVAIVVVVLAFNFVGDGLRDAADPHGTP